LEGKLKLPSRRQKSGGQFSERPGRGRAIGFGERLRFTFGHDTALALIYGAALAAWVFPLVRFLIGLVVPPPPAPVWVELLPGIVRQPPWAPPCPDWGARLPAIFGKQPWPLPCVPADGVAVGVTAVAFVLFWRVLAHLDRYPPGMPRWRARWYCETWLNGGKWRPLDKQLCKQLHKYVAASFQDKAKKQRKMFVNTTVSLANDGDPNVTWYLANDRDLDVTWHLTHTRVVGCFTTKPAASSKRAEVEATIDVARWPSLVGELPPPWKFWEITLSRKIESVVFEEHVKVMVAASTFCAWWQEINELHERDQNSKQLGRLRGALQFIGTTPGIIHATKQGGFDLDPNWVGKEVDFAIDPYLLWKHWSGNVAWCDYVAWCARVYWCVEWSGDYVDWGDYYAEALIRELATVTGIRA
jgi:hypothetical protein